MDIKVKNLTKVYGQQKAVNQVSFEIKSGEILGFLGPNGAGKSTTMKMIAGYIAPNSGSIFYGEKPLADHIEECQAKLGYLPENNPLYLNMFITDYLAYVAALQGVAAKNRAKRVKEMIAYCGLQKEKHKKIKAISKGYRQRVGLAQALIHDPEILILDEPTSGLDPNQIVEIRSLITDLSKEKTILLSTHILQEAEKSCSRILIINNGQIVADAGAEMLEKESYQGNTLKVGLAMPDLSIKDTGQKIMALEGVSNVRQEAAFWFITCQDLAKAQKSLAVFCHQNNGYITAMQLEDAGLEAMFTRLTHQKN